MGSLGRRILVATLVVAVLAAVLTGWLVRRATIDATEQAAELSLERDALILNELRALAVFGRGWSGVGPVVEALSDELGQRIAVTALDGRVLADSDPDALLPEQSSALIDPADFDASVDTNSLVVLDTDELFEGASFFPSEEDLEDFEADVLACLETNGLDTEDVLDTLDDVNLDDQFNGIGTTGPLGTEFDELLNSCLVAVEEATLVSDAEPVLLYLGYPADALVDFGSIDVAALLAIAAAVVASAAVAAALLARRITTPVRDLTLAVGQLGAGDLSVRAPTSSSGEVASLASAFNTMASDLESGEQTRQRMVRDVAHELRNPIGVLRGNLEAAQDGLFELDDEMVEMLLDETVHLSALVEDLQQLALGDAGSLAVTPEPTDLHELAEQVVSAQQSAARDADVLLELQGDSSPLDADPVRLRQVILNLVSNGIAYTPSGGSVLVRVEQEAAQVSLAVIDDGPGLSPEQQARVFDRFWRADNSRNRHTGGAGLGLSICKQLVEAHGGTIAVTDTPGGGATFTMALPAGTATD